MINKEQLFESVIFMPEKLIVNQLRKEIDIIDTRWFNRRTISLWKQDVIARQKKIKYQCIDLYSIHNIPINFVDWIFQLLRLAFYEHYDTTKQKSRANYEPERLRQRRFIKKMMDEVFRSNERFGKLQELSKEIFDTYQYEIFWERLFKSVKGEICAIPRRIGNDFFMHLAKPSVAFRRSLLLDSVIWLIVEQLNGSFNIAATRVAEIISELCTTLDLVRTNSSDYRRSKNPIVRRYLDFKKDIEDEKYSPLFIPTFPDYFTAIKDRKVRPINLPYFPFQLSDQITGYKTAFIFPLKLKQNC